MIIYHITSNSDWARAKKIGEYRAPSLDTEGFIHASTLEQVVETANLYYQGVQDLVLLKIDTDQSKPEVRFDPVYRHGQEDTFPHIYGPLNLNAVVEVIDFPTGLDGKFTLPDALTRRF